MKKLLLLILSVFGILIFSHYISQPISPESINNSGGIWLQTFNSSRKEILESFPSPPKRVIVNRLNGAETLIALGATDKLVAINMQNTDWGKDYDPRYEEQGKMLTSITYRNLTLEEALLLQPDCIIGWYSTFSNKVLGTTDFWKTHNTATYIQATSNKVKPYAGVEDECQFILDMGELFTKEEKAQELVDEIHGTLSYIHNETAQRPKPTVMIVEFRGSGFITYGYEWLAGDIVKQLGGEIPRAGGQISYEELLDINPDVIFIVYFNKDKDMVMQKFNSNPAFESLKAMRNRRIYPMRLDYMYTTAVRTNEGLKEFARGMYPDIDFSNINE